MACTYIIQERIFIGVHELVHQRVGLARLAVSLEGEEGFEERRHDLGGLETKLDEEVERRGRCAAEE